MKSHKKKVLIFIRYYLPGFRSGGPVRSVSNLVNLLSHNVDVYVICLDRDINQSHRYDDIEVNKWQHAGGSKIAYISSYLDLLKVMNDAFRTIKPDVVYLNSLMDIKFSFIPLLYSRFRNTGVLLAPRGELAVEALKIKSTRKKLYLAVITALKIFKKIKWHATSENERQRIVEVLKGDEKAITLLSNLPDQRERNPKRRNKKKGELKIVLIGRVAAMKNILFAIEIISKLGTNVTFDIWGNLEDQKYLSECLALISSKGLMEKVFFKGEIDHSLISGIYAQYHILFLPSLGENFGHVIMESLSSGMPVIISNRTPWSNLKERGVGADIPLDDEHAFISELNRYADMTQEEYEIINEKCFNFYENWLKENQNPELYEKMFENAVVA